MKHIKDFTDVTLGSEKKLKSDHQSAYLKKKYVQSQNKALLDIDLIKPKWFCHKFKKKGKHSNHVKSQQSLDTLLKLMVNERSRCLLSAACT